MHCMLLPYIYVSIVGADASAYQVEGVESSINAWYSTCAMQQSLSFPEANLSSYPLCFCSPSLTVELIYQQVSGRHCRNATHDIPQLRVGLIELFFEILCFLTQCLQLFSDRLFQLDIITIQRVPLSDYEPDYKLMCIVQSNGKRPTSCRHLCIT